MSNQAPTLPENTPADRAPVNPRVWPSTTFITSHYSRYRFLQFICLCALLPLTYSAMFIGRGFANPHVQLLAQDDTSNQALQGFYETYCDTSDCYRWMPAQAQILLTGLDCRNATLNLRLASIRPPDTALPTMMLSTPGYRLVGIPVRAEWRRYSMVVPCGPSSDTLLQIESATFQPSSRDRRQLGVAFSQLDASPLDSHQLPRLPRLLFLLALPLLSALFIGLNGGHFRWMLGVGIILVLAAGWATAMPLQAAFILPTLNLQQTPWVPLLALIVVPVLIRWRYGALPGMPWSACALILTMLIILRLGREVAFGLSILLLAILFVVARGQVIRRAKAQVASVLPHSQTSKLHPLPVIPELTGLRFFAAMAVVLYHYQNFLPHPALLNPVFQQGSASVGLFFVLSGFIITYTYTSWFSHDLSRYWAYLRARFARIFPIYALALVFGTLPTLILIRTYVVPLPSYGEIELSWFLNLLLICDFVPFPLIDTGWSLPAWSIARECVFYLIFPVLILYGLQRVQRVRTLVILAIICYALEALAFSISVVLCQWFFSADPDTFANAATRYIYQSPAVRIWEFLIGSLLGAIFLRSHTSAQIPTLGRWLQSSWVRNLLLAFAILLIALVAFFPVPDTPRGQVMHFARWYLAYTPGFTLLIAALAWGPTLLSGFLTHRWIIGLGEASYALFLIHDVPHYILPFYIARADSRTPWIVVGLLVACIVASLALYRFVETPARRWLRA